MYTSRNKNKAPAEERNHACAFLDLTDKENVDFQVCTTVINVDTAQESRQR